MTKSQRKFSLPIRKAICCEIARDNVNVNVNVNVNINECQCQCQRQRQRQHDKQCNLRNILATPSLLASMHRPIPFQHWYYMNAHSRRLFPVHSLFYEAFSSHRIATNSNIRNVRIQYNDNDDNDSDDNDDNDNDGWGWWKRHRSEVSK